MKHRGGIVLHEKRKKKSQKERNQKAWGENYPQYMWKQYQNL